MHCPPSHIPLTSPPRLHPLNERISWDGALLMSCDMMYFYKRHEEPQLEVKYNTTGYINKYAFICI